MRGFAEINRNPSGSDRLKLAVTFLIGFGLLGALQWNAGRLLAAEILGGLAVGLCLLSFVPPLGRVLYVGWMALGICIGFVTQPIIMGLAFLTFFVPLGLFFRLTGRDMLKRKVLPGSTSYWEDYPASNDPARYFKQY